jgi:hypothetical protein
MIGQRTTAWGDYWETRVLAPIAILAVMRGIRETNAAGCQRGWLFSVKSPLSIGGATTTRNRTALAKATSVAVHLPSFSAHRLNVGAVNEEISANSPHPLAIPGQ